MRILHTGDLHMDSPFCGSSLAVSEKRREMQRELLGRIFDVAVEEGCQMILIAGDLFDSRYVTPETEKYVKELFSRINMPVVISPGNHDPYVTGSFYKSIPLSENVYVFSSSELQRFDFPELGASVYGYAFTSQSMTSDPLAGQADASLNGNIALLCAHGELSALVSRYCPLDPKNIVNMGIDYAALGHVHKQGDNGGEYQNIRYCGFPEGRSFDELHEGTVIIADVEKDGCVSVRRRVVSKQRYEIVELDVSGCFVREDIAKKIRESAEKLGDVENTNLRVCLVGSAEPSLIGEITSDMSDLAGDLASLEIKDLTYPVEDISSLKADISVRGAFYNALYSGLTSDDPEVRARHVRALQIGLAAIDGRRIPLEESEA